MIVQIITAVAAMVRLANAIKNYNEDDSNQDVLERIELMQEALSNQLDEIGQAIAELTGIIEGEFDALKLETAISLSQTAMNLLYTYRDLDLPDALVEADAASSQAVELLKQQDEVFFIGGLLLAGNVRIDVIRAMDPGFASDEWRIQEINALADHLESLVVKIEQRVSSYHQVYSWEHIQSMEGLLGDMGHEPGVTFPPRITNEMAHWRSGRVMNSYPYSCSGTGCTLLSIYTQKQATILATASRGQGISDELADLGVPGMRNVVDTWRNLVVQQQIGFAYWKFLGRTVNILDAQRTQSTYIAASREAVRRVARAGEAGTSFEMQLQVDARPFMVDLLTSLEFKTRELRELDREGIYNEVLQRIFDRKPKKEEIITLRRVEDELGFDGMVAGLIYGTEYAKCYGTGVPMISKASAASKKVTTASKQSREAVAASED